MIDLTAQSIRAQILQAVGVRCQALLVPLPDETSSTAEVYWARQSLRPEELPAVVVTPGIESGERSYGVDRITMPVTISLACLLGDLIAVDLGELLLAELRQKIPLTDPTLGGLAQDLRYVQGGVDDYPDQDNQALVAAVTFEIDYETAVNNPEQGV
jgi:hypothetical protein